MGHVVHWRLAEAAKEAEAEAEAEEEEEEEEEKEEEEEEEEEGKRLIYSVGKRRTKKKLLISLFACVSNISS